MNALRYSIIGSVVFSWISMIGIASADTLRFAAMPPGASWYVAAAAIDAQVSEPLEGLGFTLEIIPRGGGVANPMVIQNMSAELGLSNVQTAALAFRGAPPYDSEASDIRALVGGLTPVYMIAMVRREYIEQTGLQTFEEIISSDEPLRLLMKPQGSNMPPAIDTMLEAHGQSRESLSARGGQVIQVDVAQFGTILRDGRADMLIDVAVPGHPMITEISLTADIAFLSLSEAAISALAEDGGSPIEMPVYFEGQEQPLKSFDAGTVLIAHANVSDDVAYAITKSVIENMEKIANDFAAYKAFVGGEHAWKPENTGIPLHPGAERYYKERGWM